MDEKADRAQVPGQQPAPERDIEPLWPTESAGSGVVPPWASVADRRDVPSSSAESSVVLPPVAAPSTGGPPVPWQPGAPAGAPPSPSDYPSLTGAVPPPGDWGVDGRSASGWAPPQPGWTPPTDPPTPAAPGPAIDDALPTPPTVDAVPGLPVTGSASNEAAGPAGPTGAAAPAVPPDGVLVGADGRAVSGPTIPAPPIVPGGVDLHQPFTLDHPAPAPVHVEHGAAAGATTAEPAAADPPETTDGGTGAPEDGPAAAATRPGTESPWAYPPQRPSGASGPANGQVAGATPPIPAPPGPQPSHPGAAQSPYAGTGTTYSGQTYAGAVGGQAGSAPIPPPPDVPRLADPPQSIAVPQQGVPVAPPPGPFPPSPGWYPPPWQQGTPGIAPAPPQQYQEAEGVTRVPPSTGYPDATWTPETTAAPTAEDFARRRQVRPADPVATMGVRAVVNKMGLLRLAPGRQEQELKRDIEMVRRNFGGLRQVTVVNPKGGAGKTVAILLLAMTFGQKRGGYVLAWDNNETQGTLGMRAQQDFHSRTVRDMLRDLGQFQGAHGRVGDLSQYVRSQGEGMFDVLASDESATGGEMLTAAAFAEIREVVSRFYKLIFVDTGNNVRAQNWQASMDATDQLVVTMSARNDSAETAARMLDHLEQSGRQRLVRQAVTVVSMPPSRKEIDLPAIQEHFAARTRAVLLAPYERLIDSGEPIRYGGLSAATRDAWLKIAAAVAEGL
ncbi:chromosome partitioning protein [Micromonospora sp. 067-2]|uniref:MinD/ParA family ATP-binding protein n=1 Tax=Micromonospora sp. 067-2 TaxID=2789270 RepID=UPI00397B4D52